MKTSTWAIGCLTLMSLTGFTLTTGATDDAEAGFEAEVSGDVSASPSGEARFGITGGLGDVPEIFTISLGANAEEGSVLFTRRSGEPVIPGTYFISDRTDGSADVQALVMTGSATRPTGVFQGRSGTLVITEVSDTTVRGRFRIEATGFLAAEPEREGRPVSVSGSFTATR